MVKMVKWILSSLIVISAASSYAAEPIKLSNGAYTLTDDFSTSFVVSGNGNYVMIPFLHFGCVDQGVQASTYFAFNAANDTYVSMSQGNHLLSIQFSSDGTSHAVCMERDYYPYWNFDL